MSALTNFCREWRQSMGFSCAEAGASLNLSDPNDTWRKYESGAKEPAAPTIQLMHRLEDCRDALKQLLEGDHAACEATLRRALPERIGLETTEVTE